MKVKFTKIFKLLITGMTVLTVASANFEPTLVSAANHVKSHKIIKKHKTAKKKIVKVATNTGSSITTQNTVQTIPNLAQDTPVIADFNQAVLNKYSLLGYLWQKPQAITYAYQNMPDQQINLIETDIKAINNLELIYLERTFDINNANIKIDLSDNLCKKYQMTDEYFGFTLPYGWTNSNFKHLHYFASADIELDDGVIKRYAGQDYDTLFKYIVLHELGHALGLVHLPDTTNKQYIMTNGINSVKKVAKTVNGEILIDQNFINSLAVLYRNY